MFHNLLQVDRLEYLLFAIKVEISVHQKARVVVLLKLLVNRSGSRIAKLHLLSLLVNNENALRQII